LQMIANRRKLIKYLKRRDLATWEKLAEKLGLKK
jgi:ribosomal protein S15P/S13E